MNAFLHPAYSSENQLQAINHTAKRIENDTGMQVIRMHLGDPQGPQRKDTNLVVADYMAHRHEDPKSRGYQDVAGDRDFRQVIANTLIKFNRLRDNPPEIGADNFIAVSGGTGALNVTLSMLEEGGTVLAPEPYYPPWENITQRSHNRFDTYELSQTDDYLINEEVVEQKIKAANDIDPGKPIWLLYHYPQNPTGKTLTEEDAKELGKRLSRLCEKHPNLHLMQEDIYLGTTASDQGIYTPLPYLSAEAKERTMWLHSPSKLGHAQDRAAVIGAFNTTLLQQVRKVSSFAMLGTSTPGLFATMETLAHIAASGLDARGKPGTDPDNFRYQLADYYQERMQIVAKGFAAIEDAIGKKDSILPGGMPGGAYYLYPSFDYLRGKPVPEALREAMGGKAVFENADDVAMALQNAHLLGLRPITMAPGTLFTRDKTTMSARLACVSDNKDLMFSAVNTFWGLTEKVLGVKLGASYESVETLRAEGPAPKPPGRKVDTNRLQVDISGGFESRFR